MKSTTSQTLSPRIEDTISAIASNISAGDTIIFCGAGISRDSGFPVVNEFVPYVLLTLHAGSDEIHAIEASLKAIADTQQRQERLLRILGERLEVSPATADKIINSLPFEAFVEQLRDNSALDNILEIYDADSYEPSVKPNINHILLAKLVATGKVRTLVTTNFDQLIEMALDQQGRQAGLDYDVLYREEDFDRIDWGQDRCRLIKIHGSTDDKQAMDITLSQVAKQELSAARAGIIRHVFSQGDHKQVLILGYSCSDAFDLSPQIEALDKNLKQVCLVQHSEVPRIEEIRGQIQKNPFKSFINSIRLFFNTSRLVESLWKATLEEPYPDAGADHKALKTFPDWKAKVHAWHADSVQKYSEAIKDIIPGLLFDAIGEWRAAIGRFERVLSYARGHADDRLEGLALNNMGEAHRDLGEHRKAIELFGQALEIDRRIEDVKDEGKVLVDMGIAYTDLGEYRKAIELFGQALEIARRIGDVRTEGKALGNMGSGCNVLGEYQTAIGLFERHLEIARRIGDVRDEGAVLGGIGSTYGQLGEYSKAIGFFEQALEIARRIGDVRTEGSILGNIGNVHLKLGEYQKAIDLFEQALEIDRRIGNENDEGKALHNMGIAYMQLGWLRKAAELFEQALEIARRIEDVKDEGSVLGSIGDAYLSIGNREKAAQAFAQSKAIFTRLGLAQMVSTVDRKMKQAGL